MVDVEVTDSTAINRDREVDLLVFGAGAGGMTTALMAKIEGLDVLLCEKTHQVGGTTATSGGTTWVPGTKSSIAAGVADSADDAARFLSAVVGNRGGEALRRAFLQSGPLAIDELERKTDVKFVAAKAHPDYIEAEGGAFGGRALSPIGFDGRLLGKDFNRIRPPRPEFMGLGGMMVGRDELTAILNRFANIANFTTTCKIVMRYLKDRLRYARGTRLLMGNALVGRLLYSLKRQNVAIAFDTALKSFIIENGRVVGAVVDSPSGCYKVFASQGVVLATGGIAWNKELREKLYPEGTRDYCLAPQTNRGEGVSQAIAIGAKLDDGGDSPALWMPCSSYRKADGGIAVWPHIILDRAKPGLLAINKSGQRFVNESDSYHDFCMGAIEADKIVPSIPAFLVADEAFIHKYGLGLVLPGGVGLQKLLKAGYVISAPILSALAEKIDVDAANLQQTVESYNRYAASGDDAAFGRGTSTMNRFNGDADVGPNPCLRKIGSGPFYTVAVRPSDLASAAGLQCDEFGRVVDQKGGVIGGLFACGNDAASIFRGTYPGPGTTIGPAIVFGWRIAKFAAGKIHDTNDNAKEG
ncbi:FAD-binding protein [Bartonella sp. LJL80]